MSLNPPVAKRVAKEISQHDHVRVDEYAWLRDENWKKFIAGDLDFADPDVKAYLQAEAAYKDKALEGYAEVRKGLYDEILSRIQEDDESYPQKRGDYYYFVRERKGLNYPILVRRKGSETGPEEVYFDINKEAADNPLYIAGYQETNRANTLLAYSFNLTGSMERTLKVRNLETGEDLPWSIDNTTGDFHWIDNDSLYFVERDESARGKNVYLFNVHQGPESKVLVFEKPSEYESMFLGTGLSNDRVFTFLTLSSGSTHVLFYGRTGSRFFEFFAKGENDVTFDVEHHKGQFYILTNQGGARDFRIMRCEATAEGVKPENWTEWLPERRGRCLVSQHIYNKYLIVIEKNNMTGLEELVIHDLETRGEPRLVSMKDAAYELSFGGNWDHESTMVRLRYEAPISPAQTIDLDLTNSKMTVLRTKPCPNFDSSRYELRREYAQARDGEYVPVTIITLKGLKQDGKAPAYVYGYGSYGIGLGHHFSSSVFSLVDRGFVVCDAHIRGGDDKGYDWYLDGKMQKKMNTFNDFIDVCEHLIKESYTSRGRIAIYGASAGGMLVSAVTNMRPDLFGAVIAGVPFVDVINTISDESLPLTPPEWEEWGNPITSKKDFEYMMAYSPYDNVEAKDYPPMLFNSGISDEQVTYWEPAKMVAKLRSMKTDSNLLVLNMKMHAGHAGASRKYERIGETAFNYGFILGTFGLR